MEKKYQVFISSTYADLTEERKKVLDVLLMADCIPAGMEAFVATDIEQFEVIKKVIDLCDYYVLIIGKRYGSIHPDTGLSYTEMEYDYAISKGIPVLVFVLDDSVELSDDIKETESDKIKQLKSFRERAMNNRLVSIWRTADELTGKMAIAIMKAKIEINRPGWQRGTDYDEASFRREIMNLQDENNRLKEDLVQKEKDLAEFAEPHNLAFDDYPIDIPYFYTIITQKGDKTRNCILKTDLKTVYLAIATEMMGVSLPESTITSTITRELPFNNKSSSIRTFPMSGTI